MCASLGRNRQLRKNLWPKQIIFRKKSKFGCNREEKKVGLEIGPNFVCKCPFETLPYAYETASKVSSAHFFRASRDV